MQQVASGAARATYVLGLDKPIVQGALTQVWHVHTASSPDCVAKFPAAACAGDPGAERLIVREWEQLCRATGPGVVRALGLARVDTGPALLTEFLPGGDLVPLAGSHPKHWAHAIDRIASVVARLHGGGIVHRDLKPRNILFDGHGQATLIDFALACSIGQRCTIDSGTAAYCNRVRRKADVASPEDDVYALAVVIFELLCGELPFGRQPDPSSAAAASSAAIEHLHEVGHARGVSELAAVAASALTAVDGDPSADLEAIRRALQAIIRAQDI